MPAPLYLLRLYLYIFFLLWTILLLSMSISRLAYTENLPPGDPLHGGINFYDPSVVALVVSAALGLIFGLFMVYILQKRITHDFLTRLRFELTSLSLLWIIWLISTAAATSVWPDLSFCIQWRACTNLQAMIAFAWIGWSALSLILGLTTFATIRHALWHEHAHGPWSDETLHWLVRRRSVSGSNSIKEYEHDRNSAPRDMAVAWGSNEQEMAEQDRGWASNEQEMAEQDRGWGAAEEVRSHGSSGTRPGSNV